MAGARAAGEQALGRVPFPKYSIALLQRESEMVQAPEFDLLPPLEADDRWEVELYTERSVRALVDSADRFDCIVVGYNAARRNPEVQAALRESAIPVGVLVLHQLDVEAYAFLRDEPLVTEQLTPPATGAHTPENTDVHEEILLNWPQPVTLSQEGVLDGTTAHIAVTPPPDSRWETVLEISYGDRRVPVLVQTSSERWPPRAVSTVLLAPRRPEHLALIGNLVTWCASGRPGAVVVHADARQKAEIIHRKLRLQGVKAVIQPVERQAKLDFRDWPLWGTRDVLLPHSWDPTLPSGWPDEDPHHAQPWLRRGHRIILLGPGDSVTVRHGESDAEWVARRWATWFNSVPTAAWHGGESDGETHAGSIVATRSILRMLALLSGTGGDTRLAGLGTGLDVLDDLAKRGMGMVGADLGLPPPSTFCEPVAQLLHDRLRGADNIDDTVSATIAALDIDALLDGQALGDRALALEHWLRRVLPERALEDRLEISRCLGDAELLLKVIQEAADDARVKAPISAVLVTSLRSAIVACGLPPELPLAPLALMPDRAVVQGELRLRPMLAAVYLLGVLDLQHVWSSAAQEPARTLRNPPPERIDLAITTLGRHGPLSRGQTGWTPPLPELASTEAIALIAYFAHHTVPTHVVRDGDSVPPQVLSAVLRRSENVRRTNEQLRTWKRRREETARRGGLVLALAGAALVLAVAILFGVELAPHVPAALEFPSAFGLWTLLTLGVLALLKRYDLPVRGSGAIANVIGGGWGYVRSALTRAVTGPEGEPSAKL